MRISLIYLFLVLLFSNCSSQIDSLLMQIAAENEVHHHSVGFSGSTSDQYRRYLKLVQSSSIEELVELLNHENSVVRSYASWGLIEKEYAQIDQVFEAFLKNDQEVITFSGCLKNLDPISSVLYHKYWNELRIRGADLATDKMLMKLDSLILYSEDPYWLLSLRALENRVYSKSFHPRIEYLAFEKLNDDAIFYLSTWHRAEYRHELKAALIKYLRETNFSKSGITNYYDTIRELLAFRDDALHEIIIEKLKQDQHWRGGLFSEKKFLLLLQDYNIYKSDL